MKPGGGGGERSLTFLLRARVVAPMVELTGFGESWEGERLK